jgi:uncharacterized protein (TIGR02001 family)
MNKKLITLAVAGAIALPGIAMAEDAAAAAPASPLSFNVGVTSDYLFRGVSQTHGAPALQGGVDYAFSNGLYVGAWGSTITWVKDGLGSGTTEIDVYGGYKGEIAKDLGYDIGYITYNYPGHGDPIANLNTGASPNTQEAYLGLSYKWLSAKYSYATSSHFIGWNAGPAWDEKTRGSGYLELNANYDLGSGWTLIGHVGHQKVKGYVPPAGTEKADYTDWKIGASKDVGFGVVSLVYSDTDTKGTCSSTGGTNAYCWTTWGSATNFKDVSKGKAVLSFNKTF